MHRSTPWIIAAAIPLLTSGCSEKPARPPLPPPQPVLPAITAFPVRLTVKQRSTTPIPGFLPPISLTIDDITRGQVMTTVVGPQGPALLAGTSFAEGDSATFQLAGQTYSLTLKRLDNATVGQDFATFSIDAAQTHPLTEEAKIERLIEHVASLPGAVFLRNGTEHSPQEAAAHLRKKWEASRSNIKTASQFITEIASGSSVSGEAYQIRWPDGRTENAQPYLRGELAKLGPAEPEPARPEPGPPKPTNPESATPASAPSKSGSTGIQHKADFKSVSGTA